MDGCYLRAEGQTKKYRAGMIGIKTRVSVEWMAANA